MIILLGQTKGGVGKSVLAANLAVILAHKKRNVLLVDADKQQSNTKWGSMRIIEGHQPLITVAAAQAKETNARDFRAKILALKDRFDDIIIDCGGHDSRELRASLTISDLLLAPVAPSVVDLWALKDFDDIVGQFAPANPNMESYVIINKAPSLNFYNQLGQTRDALSELHNLRFTGVVITERPRIQDCYQTGQGLWDLNNVNPSILKAQNEMNNLYRLVNDNDH